MLRTRFWTAAVALPAVLAILLFASNLWFTCFIALLSAWGLYEVACVNPQAGAGTCSIAVLAGATPAAGLFVFGQSSPSLPVVVILAMLALTARIGASGPGENPEGASLALLGGLYVGVLFPYFALLRNRPGGTALIVMMLLLVVASDTGAYFAGTYAGRTRLLPRVSPNKTIEGAAAAVVSTLVVGLLLWKPLLGDLRLGQILTLSVGVNLLAQAGDLAGSAYKRAVGVKDFGWVFPAHGGLLDRTCSLVFAAVFSYYYLR